jgi:hypothetical protein
MFYLLSREKEVLFSKVASIKILVYKIVSNKIIIKRIAVIFLIYVNN